MTTTISRIEHGQAGDAAQLVEPRRRVDERFERAAELAALDAGHDRRAISGRQRGTLGIHRRGQALAGFHPPADSLGQLAGLAGKFAADTRQMRFERQARANECPDLLIEDNEVGQCRRNRAACPRERSCAPLWSACEFREVAGRPEGRAGTLQYTRVCKESILRQWSA